MCGIAGFIDKLNNNWQSRITNMCNQMIERGPDGSGYWHDDGCGVTLGHRRLSILDLSDNGKQPMKSWSDRYIISFNGEIYNYKELKAELFSINSEIDFIGTSDTEVLVNSFEILGIKNTLQKIRGMFAIALYDRDEKSLYLMRDRMGEKPLYYGYNSGTFVFASNLDSIVAYRDNCSINSHAVLQYLCYGYIPGTMSIYNDIYKVLPGQCIVIDVVSERIISNEKYWDICSIAHKQRSKQSFEELSDELDVLLHDVIREQMVADVPVGAYLSGGVDSSLIVAIMQDILPQKVRTYTIGIEGSESDEAPWAQKVADYIGVNHTTEYISKEKLYNSMFNMGRVFSEPFADVSQVPTYMVSKLARHDVTVTLSGDGGDELFCGYTHYRDYPKIWNNIKTSGKYNPLMYMIADIGSVLPRNRYTDRLYDFKRKCKADSLESLYKIICESHSYGNKIVYGANLKCMAKDDVPLQKYINTDLNDMDNLMLVDQLQYLPDDILVKVDCTGMGVSLENRIPLLDKKIVEFAWSIPSEYKDDGINLKMLMRSVLYKYVSKELIERPKQGFAFPALKWIIEDRKTREWIESLLERRLQDIILNKKVINHLWNEYVRKRSGRHIIWNIVMLLIWADERNINL